MIAGMGGRGCRTREIQYVRIVRCFRAQTIEICQNYSRGVGVAADREVVMVQKMVVTFAALQEAEGTIRSGSEAMHAKLDELAADLGPLRCVKDLGQVLGVGQAAAAAVWWSVRASAGVR
jgi:hypothetical protein